ncbi:MAG TPA: lysophospholipid acyltransferase family protein [Polyangiaceae bacterium]|nr:lysophospholipid acyltransferase family protein [Polyangiaceae bacterium]
MMPSLFVSLSGVVETLAISAPTVIDALRGRVTVERCDARLKSWAARLLDQAKVARTVVHPERAATGEVFIVMSNHRSLYDVPLLIESFPGTLRMMAKSELFRVPVWGSAMRQSGFVEIDRKNGARAKEGIEVAKTRLNSGINIWIAPEGTRSRSGELGAFKSGGFRLAVATGFKILPAAIRGTERVLPADGVRVNRGAAVEIEFGEPVDPGAFGDGKRSELIRRVREIIQSML